MRTIRAMLAAAVMAIVLSLSVAPAAAQYPPTDPPATVPTEVGGVQATNTGSGTGGSGNLAFTGRSIGGIAALGVILVVAGGGFYLVGQRRRSETA